MQSTRLPATALTLFAIPLLTPCLELLRKAGKLLHQKYKGLCMHYIWTFLCRNKSCANNTEWSQHKQVFPWIRRKWKLQLKIQRCESKENFTLNSNIKTLKMRASSHVSSSSCSHSITQLINITNLNLSLEKWYFESPKFATCIIWPIPGSPHTEWNTAHIHLWKLYCTSPEDKGKTLSS